MSHVQQISPDGNGPISGKIDIILLVHACSSSRTGRQLDPEVSLQVDPVDFDALLRFSSSVFPESSFCSSYPLDVFDSHLASSSKIICSTDYYRNRQALEKPTADEWALSHVKHNHAIWFTFLGSMCQDIYHSFVMLSKTQSTSEPQWHSKNPSHSWLVVTPIIRMNQNGSTQEFCTSDSSYQDTLCITRHDDPNCHFPSQFWCTKRGCQTALFTVLKGWQRFHVTVHYSCIVTTSLLFPPPWITTRHHLPFAQGMTLPVPATQTFQKCLLGHQYGQNMDKLDREQTLPVSDDYRSPNWAKNDHKQETFS